MDRIITFCADDPTDLTTEGLVDAVFSMSRQQVDLRFAAKEINAEIDKVVEWNDKAKQELLRRLKAQEAPK